MKAPSRILFIIASLLAGLHAPARAQVAAVVPSHKAVHKLVDSSAAAAPGYPAFPALLDLGGEILVSFKHGRSHAADPGAPLEFLRLDSKTGEVRQTGAVARVENEIMQMGEWVRFANGDVASFIDAQQRDVPRRTGLLVVRSSDGGRTFQPPQKAGVVDGVEYGYAFQAATRGGTTWMLVMTFANLAGGKQVWKTASQPGSVDVIRTDDNGRTWTFVRSITSELGGVPINESSLAIHGDGFILAARGYDKRQWLLRTDAEFKVLVKADLAEAHPFIEGHLGRPRVFSRDGGWYLLARNFPPAGGPMCLSLFKFDPDTLAVTRHVLLDNAAGDDVTDGYYAMPYWAERDGRTLLNIVTYKRLGSDMPDILRLEFDWGEVR